MAKDYFFRRQASILSGESFTVFMTVRGTSLGLSEELAGSGLKGLIIFKSVPPDLDASLIKNRSVKETEVMKYI